MADAARRAVAAALVLLILLLWRPSLAVTLAALAALYAALWLADRCHHPRLGAARGRR